MDRIQMHNQPTQRFSMFSKITTLFFLSIGFLLPCAQAQTDFAPGQIMFTGYNSVDPDGFSFVILTDVLDGTVIYITDRGWTSSTGFRDDNNGEGTISFEFTADYPCGSTFVIQDVGTAPNVWVATDEYGGPTGIVTILTATTESPDQDPQGIEFNVGTGFPPPDGDQLFIYQLPEPSSGNQTAFVTGIHMNGGPWNGGNTDDYSSQQPTDLANNQVVRFNAEVNNAKYDCSPVTGSSATLQAAITNDNGTGGLISDMSNNWNENNGYLQLFPTCHFCCGTTPPVVAPALTAPCEVNVSQTFTINISGTLGAGQSWELYTSGCGVGAPLQTTTSSSFSVVAPSMQGYATYYVRSSEEVDCGGLCGTVRVFVGLNLNVCTICTADPLVCGDCYLPPPYPNPDLDSGCYEIKLIFVLDESGSIGANEPAVRNGVLAFLNALNGQDILVALIEFSELGRVVNDYTAVNNGYILNVQNYFDNIPYPGSGHTYIPNGGTNWHDAMIKVDAMAQSDMVMFFTDGVPTGWTNNGSPDFCGSGGTTQTPEIVNPVKLANKIKSEDTHMFMLGVGTGIDEINLQRMSGLDEYQEGVNTIGNSDYSIGNFVDLAEDLEAFVSELCNTPLELDKQVFGAVCNGVQQFMFITHNPGTESAATIVQVIDTFPSGYANIAYYGPPGIKLCIGADCEFYGLPPQPDNGFIWTTNSLPPGESDTLILSVDVLSGGNYTNIAWAQGTNTDLVSDTVTSPNFVDDLAPVITCPGNVVIDCSESTLPAFTGVATAIDPDGSSPVVDYADEIVDGACPDAYTINRTWTTTDGCFNTDDCLQVIDVEALEPEIISCAITRNIEGCSTAAVTGPSYSTTLMMSTLAVFENATNQGEVTNLCGTATISYMDVSSGTCPIVVTRTWTVSDLCGNTLSCAQTINVDDSAAPSITTCPVARIIEGCNTAAITGPVFATSTTASTEAVFENATNQGSTSDVCGITSVTYKDVASGTCPIAVTRTWTVTDACGNTKTCNQAITVDDTVLPTLTTCAVTRVIEGCGTSAITGPSYSTVTATSSEAVFENGTNQGSTSDACGITSVTYIDVATGTCPIVVTRKWTVSDACGNTASCNQTINVDDMVNPAVTTCAVTRNINGCNTSVITGPAYSTIPASSTEAVFENATNLGNISDACGITSVMYVDVSAGTCPTVVTRTWTIGDACGNSNTCAQTININDTAPTISNCAVTRNIEGCNTAAITGPVYSTVPLASTEAVFENATNQGSTTDLCGITSVMYVDVSSGTCPIVVSRTWTVSDVCGNATTCVQTINVDDNTVPPISGCAVTRNIEGCNTTAITGPSFSTVSTASSEAVFENATNQGNTSDVCGVSTVNYIDVASGTCPIVVTRTWSVIDGCGNVSTCAQTINVDDSVSPTISTCAVTRNIEGCNTSAITGPAFSATTATSSETVFENTTNQGISSDVCGITTVNYIDVASGTCPIVVTRTWTIKDACGNMSTCNQTINVDDMVNPTVTTCAVTRNISGCNTSAITGPAYSTTAASSTEAVFENATNQGNISDACGITTVTYIDVATGTCPIVVSRLWTLGDACGNTTTCTQTINVDDMAAPSITTCAVTRNIEGCNTAAITGPGFSSVSATSSESVFENTTNQGVSTDVCGISAVTYIDVSSGTCPIVVSRTWTVSDVCGNFTTCVQTINVDDNTVPTISGCAVTRNIEGCNTTAITGPTFSTVSTASSEVVFENTTNQGITSDACGITTVNYIDVATGTCPIVVTRTWSVIDGCGNVSTCAQTINVDDSVSPSITSCAVVRNIEGCGTSAITGPSYSTVTATSSETVFENTTNQGSTSDICGVTSVTYMDVASGTCPIVVTRKWTISDACGNTSTCNQIINVDDTVNPLISTCPITRNIQGCNTAAITSPVFSAIQANSTEMQFENATNQGVTSDICGISSVTYIDVATGTCPIVVSRLWTVSDACGNTTSCTQTINVDDTVSPSVPTCAVTRNIEGCSTAAITGPVFSTVSATSSESVFENATNQGVSSDVCGISSVTYIDVATGTCPIIVTRTWTISDACSNSITCVQTINVDDSVSPALTCPVNVTISCTAITLPSNTGNGTSTDVCDASPTVTYMDVTTASPVCPQEYTINRTWTSTDDCSNTSTCLQIITIDDSTPPVVTCPVNITIDCTQNTLPANTGTATTSDNCDAAPGLSYSDVTMAIPMSNGYLIQRTWSSSDICGNMGTCLQTITVDNPLVPEIIGLPFDTICSGSIVEFEAVDPGISPVTYEWEFGAGSNPSVAVGIGAHEVAYTYNAQNGSAGAWVILTLGTPGCADVTDTVANINVNAIPNAAITASPGNPCVYTPKTFQPTAAQMSGFSYMWHFGSGANIPTANTYGPHMVEYFPAGVKTVQLIVFSNEAGASCGDTSTVMFTVLPCLGDIIGIVEKSDGTNIPNVNVRLYADQNLDGVQDNNTAVRSVFTNAMGVYSMAALTPGDYVIVEVQPAGYVSLMDQDTTEDYDAVMNTNMNDNIIPTTIDPTEKDSNNIFTEIAAPGVISGFVFEDFDNNQMPSPIEGLPAVTIQLFTDTNTDGFPDAGGYVESAITSSTGSFTFPSVPPGHYIIRELDPSGYYNVKDFDTSPDADMVPNTNMLDDTIPVTIINGEIDAGNYFMDGAICSKLVTTVQDDVPGSLRYMMDCALNNDTIRFHPLLAGQTLLLNAGRIEIGKNLFIYSDVSPKITIQSNVSGGFKILQNNAVEFRSLDVRSGLSGFPGAAFDNYGHLILWDVSVLRNVLLPATEYLIYNGTNGMMTLKGNNFIESD